MHTLRSLLTGIFNISCIANSLPIYIYIITHDLLNTQIQLISEIFKMEEYLVIKLGYEPVSSVTMFQRLTSIIWVVKNNRDSYTGKVMILIAILWCCGKERFVCR